MIEYIYYKEEKYPVRLSYRVFQGLKKDIGEVDLKKLKSLDAEVLETMLWHGLISGCKREGKELLLKKEDMEDVLDDCFFDFIKMIPKFFPNTKLGNDVPDLEQKQKASQSPIDYDTTTGI